MKKAILLILFIIPLIVNANETESFDNIIEPQQKKNIKFEIGLLNMDIGLSNSLMPVPNYFQDKLILDLNKLEDDLNIYINAFISPLNFRFYTNKRIWVFDWKGFGVSLFFEIFGNVNISETLLSLRDTNNNKSKIGLAVFTGIDIPVFFGIKKFYFMLQPSLFFPVIYGDPRIVFTKNNSEISLDYNMRIYTIGSFENGFGGISSTPGLDFNISVEYPLSEVLGLNNKYKLLDFDIGLELINIPTIPSGMNDYIEISGSVNITNPGIVNNEESINIVSNDTVYGAEKCRVIRPFKMLIWADWRPLEKVKLSVVPVLGFSINRLYVNIFSIEGGITANIDLKNFIILSQGFNYLDRQFINSLKSIFYFKNFELNIGIDFKAGNFVQSFQGYGFGIKFGAKVRW